MARCLISFGANLGAPAVTIRQAVDEIKQRLGQRLHTLLLSRLVRTPAVGGPTGQPPFVNAVAALDVRDCSAWDMWHIVREVEHTLGRVRQERWEARRIDLDVLLFDDVRIWTPQFKLPHPRMVMRRFILQPALDVASDLLEPVTGWTISQLAESLASASASILLVGHDALRDQQIMDRAARAAQGELIDCKAIPCELTQGEILRHELSTARAAPDQRWLAWLPASALQSTGRCRLTPAPRLVIVLTPINTIADAAWEDVNRSTARGLGLCPTRPSSHEEVALSWPLEGPRYLLSTDDPAWAEHEIVAALDAMDCPVEPMRS